MGGATISPDRNGSNESDIAAQLAARDAGERLELIAERFEGRIVATTSAGVQAAVMLHLIATHAPGITVVFIDTGFHFPETYHYLETLRGTIGLDLQVYSPSMSAGRLEALHGRLWEGDEDDLNQYGVLTKVEPMDRALRDHDARGWISGLRWAQSRERAERDFVERQGDTFKLYPILDWSDEDVAGYMLAHDLPAHPLLEKGYVSIGDWHSTRPLTEGMSSEETRFNGLRRECGLHIDSQVNDYRI